MKKLEKITFSSYKRFKEENELEIKPITIILGKNSSGKSSISRLFPLLSNSMSGSLSVPFQLENNGVSLGTSFSDISHNGSNLGLCFGLSYDDGVKLKLEFISKIGDQDYWIKCCKLVNSNGEYTIEQTKENGNYIETQSRKEYSLESFRGFVNKEFFIDCGLCDIEKYKISVDYIGPFRVFPKRVYSQKSNVCSSIVGISGEYAYDNLKSSEELQKKVSDWYFENFGCCLRVKNLSKGLYSVLLSKNDEFDVNIMDEGQGMSQVLPIVTRCFMYDDEGSIVVVEQPELHLHPAAHSAIARLFSNTAKLYKHNYIIETHSQNFLLGIRNAVVDHENALSASDVVIYFINDQYDDPYLQKITLNEDGELSDWPEGVFNEAYEQLRQIHVNVESNHKVV